MSTAVATQTNKGMPIQHTVSWGRSIWRCIHPYCDGSHHVYVQCGR